MTQSWSLWSLSSIIASSFLPYIKGCGWGETTRSKHCYKTVQYLVRKSTLIQVVLRYMLRYDAIRRYGMVRDCMCVKREETRNRNRFMADLTTRVIIAYGIIHQSLRTSRGCAEAHGRPVCCGRRVHHHRPVGALQCLQVDLPVPYAAGPGSGYRACA